METLSNLASRATLETSANDRARARASTERSEPLVVGTLRNALEQNRGQVALTGVGQHCNDDAVLRCALRDFERAGDRRARRNADEDAFFARKMQCSVAS